MYRVYGISADGSVENISHAYSSPGEKSFRMSDNVTALSCYGANDPANFGLSSQLTEIKTFGTHISAIGPSCFINCSGLKRVRLTDAIRVVDDCAFRGCSQLTSVNVLDGETSAVLDNIGQRAFENTGLRKAVIELNSARDATNEQYCFAGCAQLTSVEFRGKSCIGRHMFDGCAALASVAFADYSGDLGDFAFSGCAALKQIQIPASFTHLPESFFNGCASLASVTFVDTASKPSQLAQVGPTVFAGCAQLTSIELPASITDFGQVDPQFLAGSSVRRIKFRGIPSSGFRFENYARISTFGQSGDLTVVSGDDVQFTVSDRGVSFRPVEHVDVLEESDFRYGVWYYNAEELRRFADANAAPVFAAYGPEGCAQYQHYYRNVFCDQDFQREVKGRKVFLCHVANADYSDYSLPGTPARYMAREWGDISQTDVPQLVFYWNRGGQTTKVLWRYDSIGDPGHANASTVLSKIDQYLAGFQSDAFDPPAISEYASDDQSVRYRRYDNQPGDAYGKFFQADMRNDVESAAVRVEIDGHAYDSLAVGQSVEIRDGTYQWFEITGATTYYDRHGVIFRVAGSRIDILLDFVNESYATDTVEAAFGYALGSWYQLTEASSESDFDGIVSECEQKSVKLVILETTPKKSDCKKFKQNVKDAAQFQNWMAGSGFCFVEVEDSKNKWASGAAKALKAFKIRHGLPTSSVKYPGFIVYHACANCSASGEIYVCKREVGKGHDVQWYIDYAQDGGSVPQQVDISPQQPPTPSAHPSAASTAAMKDVALVTCAVECPGYKDSFSRLRNMTQSSEIIKNIALGLGMPQSNIVQLLNKNATKKAIQEAIASFPDKKLVIFHFSDHGGKGGVCTYNGQLGPRAFWKSYSTQTSAPAMFCIFHTCHSATMMPNEADAQYIRSKKVLVWASCAYEEVCWAMCSQAEKDKFNSRFGSAGITLSPDDYGGVTELAIKYSFSDPGMSYAQLFSAYSATELARYCEDYPKANQQKYSNGFDESRPFMTA